MCVSQFADECKKSRFYYFKTVKDFDNRKDWDGRNLKKLEFKRGLIARGEYNCNTNNIPTAYYAYGTKK